MPDKRNADMDNLQAVQHIFFDHDGGVDDFIALLILLAHDDVDLVGISVTPADTFIEAAIPATRKILDLADRSAVPVAAGTLSGRNPFPDDWRMDSYKIDALPILNQRTSPIAPLVPQSGQQFLAETLIGRDRTTLLMTGPLTNLAWALERHPGIASRIERLYWMGGALDVPGNVQEEGHDGTAEWNAYWDPPAVTRVWDSSIPITMFPLDATDQVPLDDSFLRAFGPLYPHPLAAAAGTCWALTAGHVERTGLPYYAWDTLTAAAMMQPDLCTYRDIACEVVVDGPSQGRTIADSGDRIVTTATDVDADGFRRFVLRAR